jgi:hypothetical protein
MKRVKDILVLYLFNLLVIILINCLLNGKSRGTHSFKARKGRRLKTCQVLEGKLRNFCSEI